MKDFVFKTEHLPESARKLWMPKLPQPVTSPVLPGTLRHAAQEVSSGYRDLTHMEC